MAFSLKLPGFLSGAKNPADPTTVSAPTVMDDVQSASGLKAAVGLDFLNQYTITGIFLVASSRVNVRVA